MTHYRLLKMNLNRDVKVREKQCQINEYLDTLEKCLFTSYIMQHAVLKRFTNLEKFIAGEIGIRIKTLWMIIMKNCKDAAVLITSQ